MAMRVMREKKHQRWKKNLADIFDDMDKDQSGTLPPDKIIEICRVYKVELDENNIKKIADQNGNITKDKFIQFGLDIKLLDLTNRDTQKEEEPSKYSVQRKAQQAQHKSGRKDGGSGLCSCLGGNKEPEDDPQPDRIEIAFRKFDKDGDGYLDWNEFSEATKSMSPEQARRIFEKCDKAGDNRISLEEFRLTAAGQ